MAETHSVDILHNIACVYLADLWNISAYLISGCPERAKGFCRTVAHPSIKNACVNCPCLPNALIGLARQHLAGKADIIGTNAVIIENSPPNIQRELLEMCKIQGRLPRCPNIELEKIAAFKGEEETVLGQTIFACLTCARLSKLSLQFEDIQQIIDTFNCR